MAKKLPQLEELEIIYCPFSKEVIQTFGCFCPQLKTCRLTCFASYALDGTELVIAETMPELRHLSLIGKCFSNDDLRAIFLGCPHLQSLDLSESYNFKIEGDLKQMSANIKLTLSADFEYAILTSIDMDDFECYVDEENDWYNQ